MLAKVTLVPNDTFSVLMLSGSKTWHRSISSFSFPTAALSISCLSFPALYSAFSLRSPRAMAAPISLEFLGISTSRIFLSSLFLLSRLSAVTKMPLETISSSSSIPMNFISGCLFLIFFFNSTFRAGSIPDISSISETILTIISFSALKIKFSSLFSLKR